MGDEKFWREKSMVPPRFAAYHLLMVSLVILLLMIWGGFTFARRLFKTHSKPPATPSRYVPSEAEWNEAPTSSPRPDAGVPESLPVATKQYFFSRSENAFFTALAAALEGTSYQAFPNVRLNDLFRITAPGSARQSTLGRLRDKHVDFLIVARQDYQPVLAIELDGDSHDNEKQQYRDAVKDVAFRSAGLLLLRMDARKVHTATTLRDALRPHLRQAQTPVRESVRGQVGRQ